MKRSYVAAFAALFLFAASSAFAQSQPAAPPAGVTKGVVKGDMKIDFKTRKATDTTGKTKDGSPPIGAKDTYTVNLSIGAGLTKIPVKLNGTVERQPNLYSKYVQSKVQDAQLYYNLQVFVGDTGVGKWVGVVPVDQSGAFQLDKGGAAGSALRFDIDTTGSLQGYKEEFRGAMYGKAEKKEALASYTWHRVMPDGSTKTVEIKRNDPLRFENMYLAKGPTSNHPGVTVSGQMNYDYEKGNYFADNLRFTYRARDGKETTDVVSGTIKWIKDSSYKTNGKSEYQFNIVWNAKQPSGDETAVTSKGDDEEAVFAVDPTQKSLTGKVKYTDTIVGSGDDAKVTDSDVIYDLDSNGLTREQVMMFTKLWVTAIGPVNDE